MTDAPLERDYQSRRQVLKWLIRLGLGAFAVAFALPALALKTLTREREAVATGDLLVYATGDQSGQPVNLAAIEPGAAVQVFPEGKSDDQNNLIELVRLAENQGIVAYSAICTHLGCTVLANLNEEGHIVCPCHASVFDPANDAEVLNGPAGRPLPTLPISEGADGTVVANGSFSGPVGPQ